MPPPLNGKCDETKPTCNQCVKARRTCPGYKDDFELVFRSEAKTGARKSKKTGNRKASVDARAVSRTSSTVTSPISTSSIVDSLSPIAREFIIGSPVSSTGDYSTGTLSPLLPIPTEQLASCHFFSNFILVPRQGSTRGFMDYLVPLMRSEPTNSHLQHAFQACSMAHLGNRVRSTSEDIPNKALSEYTKALSATHMALQDPKMSQTDGTLAAVLLLGLYEVSLAKQPVSAASP